MHQTRAPHGYSPIQDYEITVSPTSIPTGFVVKQAPHQNAPGTRNVSFVLVDITTGQKLVGDSCLQIINASNIGCDDDLRDGQIDFLNVDAGTHQFVLIRLPAGYVEAEGPDFGHLRIDPRTAPTNIIVYVGLAPTR